ncbi:FMN-binding negative transcriptional regulator [Massilia sp. PAMC28688]|nr:FMN-binding negative transcriptional regulator [Massilia sp. PAMC28688]
MYEPKHFLETSLPVLHALIEAHPLGTWVTHADGQLAANHIPFMLDRSRGEFGTLVAHVARANDVWSARGESLVVFQGSDAYISPSWYASKQEAGKVVPTWNYAVVHAHGRVRVIEDAAWLLRHLADMSARHEAARELRWKLSDAPSDFIERLLPAIVGIEIPITRLTGKWKVSQNRSQADREGVVAGLRAQADHESNAMATLVARHRTS